MKFSFEEFLEFMRKEHPAEAEKGKGFSYYFENIFKKLNTQECQFALSCFFQADKEALDSYLEPLVEEAGYIWNSSKYPIDRFVLQYIFQKIN